MFLIVFFFFFLQIQPIKGKKHNNMHLKQFGVNLRVLQALLLLHVSTRRILNIRSAEAKTLTMESTSVSGSIFSHH